MVISIGVTCGLLGMGIGPGRRVVRILAVRTKSCAEIGATEIAKMLPKVGPQRARTARAHAYVGTRGTGTHVGGILRARRKVG